MTTQNKKLKYLLLGVIGILLGFIATCLFLSYSAKYNQSNLPTAMGKSTHNVGQLCSSLWAKLPNAVGRL